MMKKPGLGNHLLTVAFVVAITFSACHPVKQYVNIVDKRYERWGAVKHFITTEEATVHVRELGDGEETVLLIHGFGPLPPAHWQKQVKDLARHYHVLVPDLIYFGESISESEKYSVDFQTCQLKSVLDLLEVDKAHVVGLSYGGFVAATFAKNYPQTTRTLVLVDALSKFYEQDYADSIARANNKEHIVELLLPRSAHDLETLSQFSYRKSYLPGFLRRSLVNELYVNNRQDRSKLLEYVIDNKDSLKNINYNVDVPVKIIWGQRDKLIPVNNAYQLLKYYEPRATLSLIPQSGHVPNLEKRKLFNRELIAFLKKY